MPVAVPLHEIRAEFADLDDPVDRTTYLIEIGRTLPSLDEHLKTEENRVLGCQARVWLSAREHDGPPHTLEFFADSDAQIVKGLIAVLLAVYSEKTPAEIIAFPIDKLFAELKLPALVPMRSNGLTAMVRRIQAIAKVAAEREATQRPVAQPLPLVPLKPRTSHHSASGNGKAGEKFKPLLPATLITGQPEAASPLDVESIRRDFPILQTMLGDNTPLVYLDNGASTQRPKQVIDAMVEAYEHYYSNVHRAGHRLAVESSAHYEAARESVRQFLNARSPTEIIFTPGSTAGINLVARSWGDANVKDDDEILLTLMEHHSNIVPWQELAQRTGCKIRWAPITGDYQLDLDEFEKLLSPRTKLVAITAVSNVLGTINPIDQIIEVAHAAGAVVLVDAAQAVPHEPVDVRARNVDFLAFSGHKMLGPSGVGVLYGREELLDRMPPFLGGGSMIKRVTTEGFTPADLPYKFEAGTPVIVPAIGLGKAIQYLQKLGMESVRAHELLLTRRAHQLLSQIPGLRILGPEPEHKGGLVTFIMDGLHPDDISKALDIQGIAVRAGHHCAMPLHEHLGITASTRASFYVYNTLEEVGRLATGLHNARKMLGR